MLINDSSQYSWVVQILRFIGDLYCATIQRSNFARSSFYINIIDKLKTAIHQTPSLSSLFLLNKKERGVGARVPWVVGNPWVACSQGVQSLNLGTFQCLTWFKTKYLVEAHCSKRKIPSIKIVQSDSLLVIVYIGPIWTFSDLVLKQNLTKFWPAWSIQNSVRRSFQLKVQWPVSFIYFIWNIQDLK